MCPLHYFHRNHLMHTRASLMYVEIPDWNEQILRKNRISFWVLYDSKCSQTCLYSLIWTCKCSKAQMTRTMFWRRNRYSSKEHSKSQNEKHVIESYQTNQPVNLSAQVHFRFIGSCFTQLFELTINIKWYGLNDKLAERERSSLYLCQSVGGKFIDLGQYTPKALSVTLYIELSF